jgi:hypothetical protein
MTIKVDPIAFGTVTYVRGNPGRPASTETTVGPVATVNIINSEVPAVPPHFMATFQLYWTDHDGPAPAPGSLTISVNVPSQGPDTGYRQVEDEAALSLSRRLRALADALDRQLEAQQQEAD